VFTRFLKSDQTVGKYRKSEKSFTRSRKLPFTSVVTLILQKSARSLSIKLEEFSDNLGGGVSASAFVQARANLKYNFFIDANQLYVDHYYEEELDCLKFKGHRVLAIDGSHIRLPKSAEVVDYFGKREIKVSETSSDYYSSGLCTVLYDVYNKLAINSILSKTEDDERSQAERHLEFCQKGDLVVLDRGYPSFNLMSLFIEKNIDFLMRCKTGNGFNAVKKFLENKTTDDAIVDLELSRPSKKVAKGNSLKVRLIKVQLESGTTEVLATSLLDKATYLTSDFKDLYFDRWKIETYFDILKSRLDLENFSGKSLESVRQDFFSTILLSNIESDMTSEVNRELNVNSARKYNYQVNKKVAFSLIKKKAFDILASDSDMEKTINDLLLLFKKNTIPIRPDRKYERNPSRRKSNDFYKYARKFAF